MVCTGDDKDGEGNDNNLSKESPATIEHRKAAAAMAEALEGRIKAANNDALIAKVSEAIQTLIPDYDDVKLSECLGANLD